MDLLLVFLLYPLGLAQSHHVLLLVEMLHLEFSAELQDLFSLALPLWNFGHFGVEGFVQRLKVPFFLCFVHEEERRQLGVVLFEGLALFRR